MDRPDLLYIYGWGGSGKSTLKRLLDGHPQLAVTHGHDTLINTFALSDFTDDLADHRNREMLDVESLRRLLIDSKYYYLQRTYEGILTSQSPSSDDRTSFSFDGFDFYEFERTWVKKINDDGDFSIQNVLYRILQSLFEQWDAYEYDEDLCEYFVGTGCIRKDPMRFLLENFNGSKIIYVYRDPRGIIATEGSRPTKDEDLDDLLRNGTLYRIIDHYEYAKELKTEFQERVHLVTFEDYIFRTEDTMSALADFLDIDHDPVLEKATFSGNEIETNTGKKYVGEINDRWDDILTERQQRIAALQLGKLPVTKASHSELQEYLLANKNMATQHVREKAVEIRNNLI